jgi:hypothetical protein
MHTSVKCGVSTLGCSYFRLLQGHSNVKISAKYLRNVSWTLSQSATILTSKEIRRIEKYTSKNDLLQILTVNTVLKHQEKSGGILNPVFMFVRLFPQHLLGQ